MKRNLLSLIVAFTIGNSAIAQNIEVEKGPFTATWEGTAAWECPEWFKDAKFGIWAHWGPQCQAEYGDWYARHMYFPGTSQYNHHVTTYGNPSVYGFKDMINDWKAEKFNPDGLVSLYKKVGAKYFFVIGQHHDNFDLWNSTYQEWNSVNMGPKKDLMRGWKDACVKYGMPLGVSIHGSHTWTWYEGSQKFDGNLTKADGKGKWWEGYDPQELYAQNHTPSTGWDSDGTIYGQWDWNNGASIPSAEFMMKLQNRVLQCINDYEPDIIYYDDNVLPFYQVDQQYGLNMITHYYNHSANKNGGVPNVVVTGKNPESKHIKSILRDVERGIPARPLDDYWQTCTCLGDWHYSQSIYDNNSYKTAKHVIGMLVDACSKNGNLLLNVPVKGDGSIDDKEMAILDEIKAWLDVNGKSIYGTRTRSTYGEGPMYESSKTAALISSFSEPNNYSNKDVRYVHRNDTLYATIMRWPTVSTFTFESLGYSSEYYHSKIKKIELLGYGNVDFKEGIDGLTVTLPSTPTNTIAPVFEITFDKDAAGASLQEIIDAYEAKISGISAKVGYNTGFYSQSRISSFTALLNESKQYINADSKKQSEVANSLSTQYRKLISEGKIAAGAPDSNGSTNVTTSYLVQASGFSATNMGSRFGTPVNWTVENYSIPQQTSTKGIKNGIDNYQGFNALSLGVWAGEDATSYDCDVTNARIYRKIHLTPGRYYFGANFPHYYELTDEAYVFASSSLLNTNEITTNSIAYAQINQAEKGTMYGIYFTITKEQDVYVGFQANLKEGSTTQEFRIQTVQMLSYGTISSDKLSSLITKSKNATKSIICNNNTGYYNPDIYKALIDAVDMAEKAISTALDDDIENAYYLLYETYNDFEKNGKNSIQNPDKTNVTDLTEEKLIESSSFSRLDPSVTTRFATPKYWTVENFQIPNGTDGTKNGLDKYPGYECLMLGVWNDRANNQSGSLNKARIYRKVYLKAGKYYFGSTFQTINSLSKAYIFASDSLTQTSEIEKKSIAYANINDASSDGNYYGIVFTLDEPKEIYLGFQANLVAGSATQEFRAVDLLLYAYDYTPDADEDINKDGNVDSQDVLKVYEYMKTSTESPTSSTHEDINKDGKADSQDVLKIYEYMKSH